MNYKIGIFLILFSSSIKSADFTKLSGIVSEIQPGEWKEIPNTRIPLFTKKEIAEIEGKKSPGRIWGIMGSVCVIIDWTSAAFNGKKWWFFGGGHQCYGGNEVYQFDFEAIQWERLTSPAPLTGKNAAKNPTTDNCPVPAFGPPATHTYDSFVWNPVSQSIWLLRHKSFCLGALTNEQESIWEFNPVTKHWKEHHTPGFLSGFAGTAWNPLTNRIFVAPKGYGPKKVGPLEIDENGKIFRRNNRSMGVDEINISYGPQKKMYALRRWAIMSFKLTGSPLPFWKEESKIPKQIQDSSVFQGGFAFHQPSGEFVIWAGGPQVWSWSPKTKRFTSYESKSKSVPSNKKRRVFGKWVYIPEVDIFAGYNDPDKGVWLYKLGKGELVDSGN